MKHETKFKFNDEVVVLGVGNVRTNIKGELVDIVPVTIIAGRPIYKYKMWVKYSGKFIAVDEHQIELI